MNGPRPLLEGKRVAGPLIEGREGSLDLQGNLFESGGGLTQEDCTSRTYPQDCL